MPPSSIRPVYGAAVIESRNTYENQVVGEAGATTFAVYAFEVQSTTALGGVGYVRRGTVAPGVYRGGIFEVDGVDGLRELECFSIPAAVGISARPLLYALPEGRFLMGWSGGLLLLTPSSGGAFRRSILHTGRHFCRLDLSGEWNAKETESMQRPVLLEVGRKGASR